MANYVDKFILDDSEILIRDSELTNKVNQLTRIHNILGTTIEPSYLGDFLSNYSGASCVKVGNKIYVLDANNYDGYGNLRVFNLETNELELTKKILVGHANSFVYNPVDGCFYIPTGYTYNAGTRTPVNTFYKYSNNFNDVQTITAPERVYAMSFDHHTNKMYTFNKNNYLISVYEYDYTNETFELLTNNLSIIGSLNPEDYTMQDIAVNNDLMYISNTVRRTTVVDMTDFSIVGTFTISLNDSSGKFRLGEIEGWEFDDNDNLITTNAYYVNETVAEDDRFNPSSVVITQIPLFNDIANNTLTFAGGTNALYIFENEQNLFKLPSSHIHSLEQAQQVNYKFSRLYIRGAIHEYGALLVQQNMSIIITQGNSLTIDNSIYLLGGIYHLMIEDGGIFTRTNSNKVAFSLSNRPSELYINNRGVMNNIDNKQYVGCGYSKCLVVAGTLASGSILVNEYTLNAYSICFGGRAPQ